MPDNPFARLSDRGRQHARMVLELAGCLECAELVVHRGRNCNSYGCRRGSGEGCESLRKWLGCYRLAAQQLAAERAAYPKEDLNPRPDQATQGREVAP